VSQGKLVVSFTKPRGAVAPTVAWHALNTRSCSEGHWLEFSFLPAGSVQVLPLIRARG
jgi:hypothetical protein